MSARRPPALAAGVRPSSACWPQRTVRRTAGTKIGIARLTGQVAVAIGLPERAPKDDDMLDLLAALALAPVAPVTDAKLPAAPWWERITVTVDGNGQSQGCLYTSSSGERSNDCKVEAADSSTGEHSATARDQVTRITFERRFTPGALTAADAEVETGDTLIGREVMALAIDGRGSVKTCKVVATSGDMSMDYGCAEAQAERFKASARRGEPMAQRQGYMTVMVYAHAEHVA